MKKLIAFSLFLGLSLGQLFAATANSVADEHGRLWNTAYFDVTLKSQAPMLDYIRYSNRASFDLKQYLDTINKIRERRISVNIHGRIEVPSTVTTPEVYVSSGSKYLYLNNPSSLKYSSNAKVIQYNNNKKFQNAEFFLVTPKKDKFGNRYIDYKITLKVDEPAALKADHATIPSQIKFTVAPKTRGFKNKFESTKIYVFDE